MKTLSASFVGVLLAFAPASVWSDRVPAWIERLGWTLVHSVWQLAAVAVLAALVDRALRRCSADARYSAGVTALGFILTLPCVTWTLVAVEPRSGQTVMASVPEVPSRRDAAPIEQTTDDNETSPHPARRGGSRDFALLESTTTSSSAESREPLGQAQWGKGRDQIWPRTLAWARAAIEPRLPWLVALWLAGVLLCSLRPAWGLGTQSRLRRVGLSPVSEPVQRMLLDLARRMRLAQVVHIAESTFVRVPMVVGYLRPMILLPASVLIGLTPTQLEAVLAHELAHVRRHDWLINTLQVLAETMLFYHPAVWWLSNRIRHERELCCDDRALSLIHDKAVFARTLLLLEELRQSTFTPALAATGGDLAHRVRRLLPTGQVSRRQTQGAGATVLVTLCLSLALFFGTFVASRRTVATESPPRPENATDDKRDHTALRLAKSTAQAAKAEYEKMHSSNRKVPGSIPQNIIIQFRCQSEIADLQVTLEELRLAEKDTREVKVAIAGKTVEPLKFNLDLMLASNRKVPGSIPRVEVERARLTYELALLDVQKAERRTKGEDTADLDVQSVRNQHDVAKAEYDQMLETNRKVPGTLPQTELDRSRLAWERIAAELKRAEARAEQKPRAGRGSTDPALDPTAGLPKTDEETNPTNNANVDLRSNPAAGSGDPRRAQQPQSKESQALFQQWQRTSRTNGNIPGGTLGPLVRVMRNFVKNNPTHEGAPKFAELLKRIEVTRDWSRDEAVKLLDEVAAIYPSLPEWVEGEKRFKLGSDVVVGKPFPEELKNAPWGEAQPNGLRVAWLLEPRALKYRLGTPLKSRILFHNAGKNSVVFRALTWNQSGGHKAADAQGTEIHINSTYWTTIPMTIACRLAPGEFLEVVGAGIGVGANKDDEDWRDTRSEVRVGSWIEAKAGDEVTFSHAAVDAAGREGPHPEGEEAETTPQSWWLKFIKDRLSLDAPLPVAADERRRLLDRAVRDLFGNAPTPEEITAFTTDAAPDALDALAQRLANRAGFVPFSGSLKSGTRKFLVLPPDPDAAKKPRSAKGPGQYTLGGATFVVTRRPIGERVVNEAHLAFSPTDATKPAPRKPHPVPLPDDYDSWIAAWMRGGTVLWVAQTGADKKESIRRYDFTNPESVKETVITELKPSEALPQAILDVLRTSLAFNPNANGVGANNDDAANSKPAHADVAFATKDRD